MERHSSCLKDSSASSVRYIPPRPLSATSVWDSDGGAGTGLVTGRRAVTRVSRLCSRELVEHSSTTRGTRCWRLSPTQGSGLIHMGDHPDQDLDRKRSAAGRSSLAEKLTRCTGPRFAALLLIDTPIDSEAAPEGIVYLFLWVSLSVRICLKPPRHDLPLNDHSNAKPNPRTRA
ncbi:hypothetical protein VTN96DRAFT_10075 [Rasamsonia emersonii]